MNNVETIVTEGVDNSDVVNIPYNKLIKGKRNVRTVKPEKQVVLAR